MKRVLALAGGQALQALETRSTLDYQGCFSLDVETSAAVKAMPYPYANPDTCASYCGSSGYSYLAIQSQFCLCWASPPEILKQYNSSDCAFSCDEPHQDIGCGGVESDTLVQLFSYYIQSDGSISASPSNGSIGTSSLINSATTSNILKSVTPLPTTYPVSDPAGFGTSSVLVPKPSPSTWLLTTHIDTNTPTSTVMTPEVDGTGVRTTTNTPQVSGVSPSQASVPASVSPPSKAGAGTTANSEPTVSTGASPTTASAAVATTVCTHYREAFWVSITPFIRAGDLFDGYTLSSADADTDGFTLWWDPINHGIGGIVWPKSGSTTWFIQVTMSRADETAYYSFDIEIDVSPIEGSISASIDITEAASPTPTIESTDNSVSGNAFTTSVDSDPVATATTSARAAANNSISLRDVYELFPGETFAIVLTEVFNHPDDQLVSYVITTLPPGYNTSWISYDAKTSSFYGKAPDDLPDMTLLFTIVAAPSSSTKRQSGTYSFAIKLMVQASLPDTTYLAPTTASSSTSLSPPYLATNTSSSMIHPPFYLSIGPSGIQPTPSADSTPGSGSSSSLGDPDSTTLTTLSVTTYTMTLWTTTTSYYNLCPSCPIQSSIIQVPTATTSVAAELFTSSLLVTVMGTCDDGSMTTQSVPTSILVAYNPLESYTSEIVDGDSTATVLVAITSLPVVGLVQGPIGTLSSAAAAAATNHLTSGIYLNGTSSLTAAADPGPDSVAGSIAAVTEAPAPTRNSTATPPVTSRVLSRSSLTAGGLETDSATEPVVVVTSTILASSSSAAAQPMTAGALGRDGVGRLEIKAAIVLGVAVGIMFLA